VNYSEPTTADAGRENPSSLSELVDTHKLVIRGSPSVELLTQHCTLNPDDTPLVAATKVL